MLLYKHENGRYYSRYIQYVSNIKKLLTHSVLGGLLRKYMQGTGLFYDLSYCQLSSNLTHQKNYLSSTKWY